MKSKMKKAFQQFEGGLFSTVEKADVGDGFEQMRAGWCRYDELGRPVSTR